MINRNRQAATRLLLPALLALASAAASAADAVVYCTLTPDAVISESQSLEITATCPQAVTSIIWWLNDTNIGQADLNQATASPIRFTIPTLLGASTTPYRVVVSGYAGTSPIKTSRPALVVVRPADVLSGVATNHRVPGSCGSANNSAVTSLPSGTAACSVGTVTNAVASSTSYNWSCASTSGGAPAVCQATKGYTVTARVVGGNGTLTSPASQPVVAGATATITATPNSGYTGSFTGCGGSGSGTSYTTPAIYSDCEVQVSFSNSPITGVCATLGAQASEPAESSLCTSGTPRNTQNVLSLTSTAAQYSWVCYGQNGGNDSGTCTAARSYAVTATNNGSNIGTATVTSSPVTYGATATVTGTMTTTGYTPTVDTTPTNACPAGVSPTVNGLSYTYTTGAITGACQVSMTFPQTPTGITCNGVTMPGNVVEVPTQLPAVTMDRTQYPANPNDVYAFKIVVPQTATQYSRALNAIKLVTTTSPRLTVISTCRGDYVTTGKDSGCYGTGVEVSTVNFTVNYSDTLAPRSTYCHLTPGTTYWANVSARATPASNPGCTSTATCGFYFAN